MKRQYLILLVMLAWTVCALQNGAHAQGPLTQAAIELAEAGELDQAQDQIASALSTAEVENPMTWYVQAYVLKELYIRNGRNPSSPERNDAVASARECLRLDAARRLEKWWGPLLEFLADSYLLDVRMDIQNVTPDAPVEAERRFAAYQEVQQILDADWDPQEEWVLMHQQLGETAMASALLLESASAGPWFALGTHHYQQAASQAHDQYRSLYNLAVHTYNQGVREFKASEDNLDAMDAALKSAAVHWQKASDLLESAIALNDADPQGFEALAIVSTALLNQDRIEWCTSHLEELKGR